MSLQTCSRAQLEAAADLHVPSNAPVEATCAEDEEQVHVLLHSGLQSFPVAELARDQK